MSGDTAGWYETAAGGANWTKVADPCANTGFPGSSPWTSLAVGPDGTRWAVCGSQPGTGQQPKDLVTSTDGGKTWHDHGRVETSGYGISVYPESATTAWRTGSRADLYRTTDGGAHWSDVASIGGAGGAAAFTALDADTAVYYAAGAGTEYVTRDGGQTWTTHPGPAAT